MDHIDGFTTGILLKRIFELHLIPIVRLYCYVGKISHTISRAQRFTCYIPMNSMHISMHVEYIR